MLSYDSRMEQPHQKRDTKRIGDRSEIEVMAGLNRAGYAVFVPFGENHRFDLIASKDGTLSRVQVKTGRLRRGVILFACWSSHSHRKGPSVRTYAGEIDYFAVYCPDVDRVFMVPIGDVRTSGALRWLPTKNGQNSRVRWALPYILAGKSSHPVGTLAGGEVPSAGVAGLPL
jgi:hypothetical protein